MFRRRRCVLDTEKVSLCHALRLWETLGVKKICWKLVTQIVTSRMEFFPLLFQEEKILHLKNIQNIESRILLMWRIWSDIVYVLMRNTDKGRGDGGCDVRFQELSTNHSLEAFTVYTCSKSAVGGDASIRRKHRWQSVLID